VDVTGGMVVVGVGTMNKSIVTNFAIILQQFYYVASNDSRVIKS